MGILDFFRTEKQEDSGTSSIVSYSQQIAWKGAEESQEYFTRNEWVFAAIKAIASGVSRTPLRLYSKDSKDEVTEIKKHPILDLLNTPTPGKTEKMFLVEIVQALLLTGESHHKQFQGTGANKVGEILPIETQNIVMDVDSWGRILKVCVSAKNGGKKPIEMNEWMYFRLPDPANPGRGASPLKAAALTVDTDIEAQNFQWNYFRNGAVLSGIFKSDQKLTPEDSQKLEKQWETKFGGSNKSGKTAFLGQGASYQAISEGVSGIGTEQRDALRDRILAAFGVPKSIIGQIGDVNFASAKAMEFVFAQWVIQPMLDALEDTLNSQLVERWYKDGLFLKFDDPTPVDSDQRNKYLEVAQTFLTVNEIREEEGFDAIEGGDRFFVEVKNDAGEPLGANDTKALASIKGMGKKGMDDEEREEFVKSFLAQHKKNEDTLEKKTKKFFVEQEKRVLKNLEKSMSKTKAINPNPVDFDKEVKFTELFFADTLVDILEAEAKRQINNVPFSWSFDLQNPQVQKFAEGATLKFAQEVTQTTQDALKVVVADGIAEGLSAGDVAKNISDKFKQWRGEEARALTIARTETTKFSNGGAKLLYVQNGVEKNEWITTIDGRERGAHKAADGQVRAIDKDFSVGGESLAAPGLGSDPGNNVNCRCAIAPLF